MRCVAYPQASPPGPPLPVDQLLSQALSLYRSAFGPLLGAAALGAVLSVALGATFSPSSLPTFYVWLFVTLVPLTIAQAAILVMVTQKRAGGAPDIVSGYTLALPMSPAFVGAAVIYAGSILLPLSTIILTPLALFLLARWALFGPAVVVETISGPQSLARSWNLTQRRGMRTFGIQALMIALRAIAELVSVGITAALGGGAGPAIVAGGLMVALVQPLWTITNLLLFEDYRRLTDEAQGGADDGPPEAPSLKPPGSEPGNDLRRS